MKAILFALCAIFAGVNSYVVINTPLGEPAHLLGAKECTWGPGYWCTNITTAAGCHQTTQCIKKVWQKMTVPEDRDSVCQVCKDMVQQARDQLESNQTQEDLKAVFEGSCALMIVKPIVEECDKLVDQFIPELVETLASQMNPSVVCSVSGLCNSPRIDQLLLEHEESMKKGNGKEWVSLKNDEVEPDECSKCYTIATHMEDKFMATSRDGVLDGFLNLCGQLSSFSDACSNIVIEHFATFYDHLVGNFKANNICHLSGQCSGIFHKHEDETSKGPAVEIRPLSSVGMVEVGDDLPCKLCEQLVGHLRDLLVANTTEAEFKQVLDGLCKQTKSFASECVSIVDQYYPEMYSFLVNGLNKVAVCEMAGICPAPGKKEFSGVIAPMLPAKSAAIGVRIWNNGQKNLGMNGAGMRKEYPEHAKKVFVNTFVNVGVNGAGIRKDYPVSEADAMQLPFDKLMSPPVLSFANTDVKGQKTCAFCEYLLHYLQQIITNPSTEADVKNVVEKVCKKLPTAIQGTCDEFLDTYGDALIALLAQEIDPSMVCPMMNACPNKEFMSDWEKLPKEYMLKKPKAPEDKPSCPLCLLAVTQVYNVIKQNKTEEGIISELDKLCKYMPNSLKDECVELVKVYSKEIIDALLADMTPQEVCVYIKMCDETKKITPKIFFPIDKDGEIATNEIPDFPVESMKPVKDDTGCVVCEFAMKYVERAMRNKSTKDEIEKIVHGACNYLPSTIGKECNDFVNQYADLVIELLSQEVSPHEICTLIGLCQANVQQVLDSIAECAMCQAILSGIDEVLTNPKVDHKIEDVVAKACDYIPPSKHGKCVMMLEVYEQTIINLLKRNMDTKHICTEMSLCAASDFFVMSKGLFRDRRADDDLGVKRCTWGDEYICSDLKTANECKALDHCKKNVWKGEHPPSTPSQAVGTETAART